MNNKFLTLIIIFLLSSCGYPDIDNVPDFKDALLTYEEIVEFCSEINTNKKNIDKCVNDYKSN
tara:strand:- start:5392 stop:5580 length:189 start_codon:yes stop_codon:yes gene_type:complete